MVVQMVNLGDILFNTNSAKINLAGMILQKLQQNLKVNGPYPRFILRLSVNNDIIDLL